MTNALDVLVIGDRSSERVIEAEHGGLRVDVTIPTAIDQRLQHAVAVRVLDAVRAARRSYGHVDVDVRGTTV